MMTYFHGGSKISVLGIVARLCANQSKRQHRTGARIDFSKFYINITFERHFLWVWNGRRESKPQSYRLETSTVRMVLLPKLDARIAVIEGCDRDNSDAICVMAQPKNFIVPQVI